MKKYIILVYVCISAICIYSCKKAALTTYDCVGVSSTYTANVKQIMDASCATSNCHSASKKADGIDLSSYAAVKNSASSDKFLGSMQHISGYSTMPKGASKLDDATVKLVSCWVNNGMPQ